MPLCIPLQAVKRFLFAHFLHSIFHCIDNGFGKRKRDVAYAHTNNSLAAVFL